MIGYTSLGPPDPPAILCRECGQEFSPDGDEELCSDCTPNPEGHYMGCICADCSNAELTADND